MRTILTIIFLGILFSTNAQDTVKAPVKKAKHFNLVKVGASFQGDVMFNNRYDYEDYYGQHKSYYHEGLNTKVFLGYEHIWEYSRIAIGLEPIAGISIYEKASAAFIGNNAKLYWANTDVWRMGIAIFMGYTYANNETSISVPMDGGNYYQRIDITMHYHLFSTNISIIPFQFRPKNTPLIIEGQFALFGINVLTERSQSYQSASDEKERFYERYVNPYAFKAELKIGFVLP